MVLFFDTRFRAGLGSQEAREQEAVEAERQHSGELAEPSGRNDLPPAGTRQPQGGRREQPAETVRRGAFPETGIQFTARRRKSMQRMLDTHCKVFMVNPEAIRLSI